MTTFVTSDSTLCISLPIASFNSMTVRKLAWKPFSSSNTRGKSQGVEDLYSLDRAGHSTFQTEKCLVVFWGLWANLCHGYQLIFKNSHLSRFERDLVLFNQFIEYWDIEICLRVPCLSIILVVFDSRTAYLKQKLNFFQYTCVPNNSRQDSENKRNLYIKLKR